MFYGPQMNPNERNPIEVRWSVKGIRHTRIRPPQDAILNVHKEADNPYGPYAIRVTIPQITDMPEEARPWQCRYQNDVRAMHDLAGETVGHVPANLCKALSIFIKGSGLIQGDINIYKGDHNWGVSPESAATSAAEISKGCRTTGKRCDRRWG